MQNIRNDIKNNSFKKVYLLFGEEQYLVRRYRDALKKAGLSGDDSGVNYNAYTGNDLDVNELKEILVTLPFFADRRVVMLDDSGLFSKENDLADVIADIPDSTLFIISEESVDKRSRLYKEIKKTGYVCEFAAMGPDDKVKFAASEISKAGKRIRVETCNYLVDYIGGDLFNVSSEIDKLICYMGAEEVVTEDAVRAICTPQIENKVFKIVDCLLAHDRAGAMKIYYDLIALRESPLRILRVVTGQYNRLYTCADLAARGEADMQIASEMHIADWLVRNLRGQLKGRKRKTFLSAVKLCTEAETDIKTGNLSEDSGMEILLANLSAL